METEAPISRSGGDSWTRVGKTLPVRNVQALAACTDELTVEGLERYIWPDIDDGEVLAAEQSGEVPAIDLRRLLDPDHLEEEAARLRSACQDWGFFQLVNHRVPDETIENIKRDIQEFFKLPLEVKNAYAQRPGDLQGYGQAFVVSEDQKLDWSDLFGIYAQPPEARDLSYWPTHPHTFRKSIEDYSSELMQVAHYVVTFIAKTLHIDTELMEDKYVCQALRMNYYPPCMSMAEKVLGFSPHSDGSFITLLLQVNPVEGLQIRRHGAWVPVKPHPEALLVNVGDFLEIMSNGTYKSIELRVTINANQERLSISAFHIPLFDGTVSPVTRPPEEKVLYKTVTVKEYAELYMSNKLDGKRTLDHAKLF